MGQDYQCFLCFQAKLQEFALLLSSQTYSVHHAQKKTNLPIAFFVHLKNQHLVFRNSVLH